MARRARGRSRSWAGCGCPSGAKKISTRGHGRGWVCQSRAFKRARGGRRYKPFVKATCR
jgi:hypothetical protein